MIIGENINIGIGVESAAARGTPVAPAVWVGGRSPTGVKQKVDKILIKETRGGNIMSSGSEITEKHAEGELEFNVRPNSFGYILLSLMGKVTSALKAGETTVYTHLFEVLTGNPQYPTITVALAQTGNYQDYQYPNAIVTSLEINTPVKELVNAKANFVATKENTTSAYTVAFSTTDYYFRSYDVTIKLATNLAGLAGATAVKPKDFSFTIDNNGAPNQHISELNPADVLAMLQEIKGSISFDYLDETYHDLMASNTPKAMRIQMTRSDITIGSAAHPDITIDIAKATFEDWDQDRPMGDIVTDKLSWTANYSDADSKAYTITLTNTIATYAVA